uniref:Uncharacterized protein n=1 Tax=Pavo cristatus TaxID=9049 RepID=A0A8C9G2G5_PAVCR
MAAGAAAAALGREGGEDAFRRLFRFYRQHDAADLRGVVDFSVLLLFSGPAGCLGPEEVGRDRKGSGCASPTRGTCGQNWGSLPLGEVSFPVVSTTIWFSHEQESL